MHAWLPCDEDDLIGPGIAIDETAQLKDRDATACAAPQHAGCTGHVENCVTTVLAAYVTTSGQAWADFDVFMPGRWDKDLARRRAAGIPGRLERKTKPQLAEDQLERLLKAGSRPDSGSAGRGGRTDNKAVLCAGAHEGWLHSVTAGPFPPGSCKVTQGNRRRRQYLRGNASSARRLQGREPERSGWARR